jgi:hemerythrin-like domain-containing protein
VLHHDHELAGARGRAINGWRISRRYVTSEKSVRVTISKSDMASSRTADLIGQCKLSQPRLCLIEVDQARPQTRSHLRHIKAGAMPPASNGRQVVNLEIRHELDAQIIRSPRGERVARRLRRARCLSPRDLADAEPARRRGRGPRRARPGPGCTATAAEVIRFFSTTARQHHEDEERHIFPALLAGGDPDVVQAVLRLQQDHHWMDVDWMELAPLVAAVAAGQDGYDLAALREGIEIFTGLTQDHIALEESYIYPAARARLRAGELRDMGRELAKVHRAKRAGRAKEPAVRKDTLGAHS